MDPSHEKYPFPQGVRRTRPTVQSWVLCLVPLFLFFMDMGGYWNLSQETVRKIEEEEASLISYQK